MFGEWMMIEYTITPTKELAALKADLAKAKVELAKMKEEFAREKTNSRYWFDLACEKGKQAANASRSALEDAKKLASRETEAKNYWFDRFQACETERLTAVRGLAAFQRLLPDVDPSRAKVIGRDVWLRHYTVAA